MTSDRDQAEPRLRELIETAPTLWRLTCAVLSFWREAGLDTPPNADADDARYSAWAEIVEQTVDLFATVRTPDQIAREERAALTYLIHGAPSVLDGAHAVAWGLALATSYTFFPAWRDALGPTPIALKQGDMYPVADAPWNLRDGLALTPRPASLSSPKPGELPTVRVHDGSFDVTVDTSLERPLEAIVAELAIAAAGHPNIDWVDLDVPSGDLIFPIVPKDPALQSERLASLLEDAHTAAAPITVLPELSLTPELVEQMAPRVEAFDAPALVVAGSYHAVVDGKPENVAIGLVAGTSNRMVQSKNVPFTDELGLDRPSKEGIRARARPMLSIYPADRYRFGIAICRDVLDQRVCDAYDRMGVNVLLVPAFSAKTQPFLDAVAGRVAGAQALTVVVNGPLNDSAGNPLRPAIIVGQPVAGETVVEHATSDAIGLTTFDLPLAPADDG